MWVDFIEFSIFLILSRGHLVTKLMWRGHAQSYELAKVTSEGCREKLVRVGDECHIRQKLVSGVPKLASYGDSK